MNEQNSRRILLTGVMAVVVSLLVVLLQPTLIRWDDVLFSELLRAFKDLSGTVSGGTRESVSQLSLPRLAAEGFFFSAASAFVAYRLSRTTMLFLMVQLCVLSVLYQSLGWRFANLQGYSVSLLVSIFLGCIVGLGLKRMDENRLASDALRVQLELRNRELLESRLAIVKQDERERRLLAADLHDQVLNDLKKISEQVDTLSSTPEEGFGQQIQSSLKAVMGEIREIMDNLCPVVLEHFGLAAAVEECLEKGAQRSGFEFQLDQRAPESYINNLSTVEKQLLFRLVQESVTNICKHADASRVCVTFEDGGNQLVISVEDNGKGIAKEMVAESSRGLLYMKLRAALIGAQIHWLAGAEKTGTRVEIRTRPSADLAHADGQ